MFNTGKREGGGEELFDQPIKRLGHNACSKTKGKKVRPRTGEKFQSEGTITRFFTTRGHKKKGGSLTGRKKKSFWG